jgi:ribosome-associated toxin RatA of RatAB toxin-antitoxin module
VNAREQGCGRRGLLVARAQKRGLRSIGGPHLALLWLLGCCLFALVCVDSIGAAEDVARKPFSADEKARLVAGKLVTRSVTEQRTGLRLMGGSSWQVIKAPPGLVFRVLLDTKNYPHSLPTVSRASLVSDTGTTRRVRLEHRKGPVGMAYRLALTIDYERRHVNFKLNDRLESGMRAAWGYLVVTPHGPDQTLLSYGVMMDPGDSLLVSLVRGRIHEWTLKVPAQMKKFIESPYGRRLYPLPAATPAAPRDRVGQAAASSLADGGCWLADGGQTQKCAP